MIELQGKYNTAKIFTDNVESSAQAQIIQLCNQEFVKESKIRVMPDVHSGTGCVIGMTMTIGDKIVPNIVGVDISCFTGDTKVPCLDGKLYTLKELTDKGEEVYVYSLDSNHKIVPGIARPFKAKSNAELMEVIVSGGETITCTPDHLFMRYDGSFVEAKDLKSFDSLMPFYRTFQNKDGYEHVVAKPGTGGVTHKIVYQHFFGEVAKGQHIHHKNFKWYDNRPDNLESLNSSEHPRLHRHVKSMFTHPEFQQKKKKTIKDRGYYYDPKYEDKKKQVAISNLADYLHSEQFKEDVKNNGKQGAKYLTTFNTVNNSTPYTCKCGRVIYGKGGFRRHQQHCKSKFNHKVLEVRYIKRKEDVYCLDVKDYHNFALSAGVFVHNCGLFVVKLHDKNINMKNLDDFIRKYIPSGANIREKAHTFNDFISYGNLRCKKHINLNRAIMSMGTLGGGNHFIEIDIDSDQNLYLLIHSGSRYLGKQVCEYYQNLAYNEMHFSKETIQKTINNLKTTNRTHMIQEELQKLKNTVPKIPKELAYLEGQNTEDYLHDIEIIQKYSILNRKAIATDICKGIGLEVISSFTTIHNYVDTKNRILRKGAVSAQAGEELIIPINMRDGSLLCIGKGNEDWNYSAPHGAGRTMSRSKAKSILSMEKFEQEMKNAGIYTTSINQSTLDESGDAYKPIEEIIVNIGDTVDIKKKIIPIYNYKSSEDATYKKGKKIEGSD